MPKNQITQELEKEFSQGNLKPSQLKKSRSAEELKPASEKQELAFLRAENTDLRIQLAELTRAFDQTKKVWEQEKNALIDQNNELRLQHLKDSDALKASQTNEDKYFAKYQAESKSNSQLKMQIANLQRQLTLTQQDLKQAQRIIELKLPENQKQTNSQPNYWKWLTLTLGGIVLWIWLKGAAQ